MELLLDSASFDKFKNGQWEEIDSSRLPMFLFTIVKALNAESRSYNEEFIEKVACFERVKSIAECMGIDFEELYGTLKKELKAKKKSARISDKLEDPANSNFERASMSDKCYCLIAELSYMAFWFDLDKEKLGSRAFEPLNNPAYTEDVADLLIVSISEMPHFIDLSVLSEALLLYRMGPVLVQRLVANNPYDLYPVLKELVTNASEGEDRKSLLISQRRNKTISLLCQMAPEIRGYVRELCVEKNVLAEFLLRDLVLDNDFYSSVALISRIMAKNDSTRSWFIHHIQNSSKGSKNFDPLGQLISKLMNASKDLQTSKSDDFLPIDCVRNSKSILTLCALLKCLGNIKFSEDEGAIILELLCSKQKPTVAADSLISTSLAVLISCAGLCSTSAAELQVVAYLKWLLKELPVFERSLNQRATYGEMLLLIALHFHAGQYHPMSHLISSVLGIKIQIKSNSISKIKAIFTQEVLTEQVIVEMAATIPVTESLTSEAPGHLPIHCIHQLLKSRMFTKHKVPIKDWILKQLRGCSTPVHQVVPQLLEAFVKSCVVSYGGGTDRINAPIEEEALMKCFSEDPLNRNLITFRVLLLYLVVVFEESWFSQTKSFGGVSVEPYSSALHENIPVKFLMTHVSEHIQDYACIYPTLLKLVTTHYQYLFMIREPLINAATLDDVVIEPSQLEEPLSISSFKKSFLEPSQAASCLIYCKCFFELSPSEQIPFLEPFVECLPALLRKETPYLVLSAAVQVWERMEYLLPRKLYRLTVWNLTTSADQVLKRAPSHKDLCSDPLCVLRCDERIFRCPAILELLLRILSCYLLASKLDLNHQLLSQSVALKASTSGALPQLAANVQAEREELVRALIFAQESGAVQILLECCVASEGEENVEFSALQEIRTIICSYLHQIFILEPTIVKLVHFQGYNHTLIPITVTGIPSMHICLDFLPELLQQANISKQIFAVDLLSYLSEEYCIPKALSCARLAVNVFNTILSASPSVNISDIFGPVTPAFMRLTRTFPPISAEIVSMLVQVARIVASRFACQYGISVDSAEKYVLSDETELRIKIPEGSLEMKDSKEVEVLTLIQTEFRKVLPLFAEYTARLMCVESLSPIDNFTLNSWTGWIDNGDGVDVVYIDFSKTFDTVSHQKLLHKLSGIGILGAARNWIKLSNRKQCVKVEDTLSQFAAVLDPILLYIKDAVKHCRVKLFADDSKFLTEFLMLVIVPNCKNILRIFTGRLKGGLGKM